jgi:hypothetical protein
MKQSLISITAQSKKKRVSHVYARSRALTSTLLLVFLCGLRTRVVSSIDSTTISEYKVDSNGQVQVEKDVDVDMGVIDDKREKEGRKLVYSKRYLQSFSVDGEEDSEEDIEEDIRQKYKNNDIYAEEEYHKFEEDDEDFVDYYYGYDVEAGGINVFEELQEVGDEDEGNSNINFDWKAHGTTADFWIKLGCNEIFKNPRPVYDQSAWEHARDMYKKLATKDNCTLPDDNSNGFDVAFEAKESPGKGRGIYAAQDIEDGTLVYQARQTARFDNGAAYRQFILSLERGFACDVLQWAYIQDVGKEDESKILISVDLDEGSFCNDGGYDYSDNLGCDEDLGETVEGGCKSNYFAIDDIEAGEELLCDYHNFALQDGWYAFGLL